MKIFTPFVQNEKTMVDPRMNFFVGPLKHDALPLSVSQRESDKRRGSPGDSAGENSQKKGNKKAPVSASLLLRN